MKIGYHFLHSVLLLSIGLTLGCHRREEQFTAEAQTADKIMALLKWYELENPGVRVTNLSEIFVGPRQGYPWEWHRRFKRFGKHAGFTNSIFEKYVFLPPGRTNRYVEGEIIVVSAQPYPSPRGSVRLIISRVGPEQYRRGSYEEERIPRIIGDIPTPHPMPAPPPAPPEIRDETPVLNRLSAYFFGFTQANGINDRIAAALWYGLLSLPVILVLGFAFWLWRRTLKQHRA